MLFSVPGKNEQQKETAGDGQSFPGENVYPANMKLQSVLAMLSNSRCVHWVSEGDWSMHDLLFSLLDYTGPANVYLSSYAFSEFPARMIAEYKSRKIIKDLFCLIDKRLDVRSASALTMIKNVATRLELVNTHAKVTVIENDEHLIVVIGSANYTVNKRYECGVIITDSAAALFHKNWMINAFKNN